MEGHEPMHVEDMSSDLHKMASFCTQDESPSEDVILDETRQVDRCEDQQLLQLQPLRHVLLLRCVSRFDLLACNIILIISLWS